MDAAWIAAARARIDARGELPLSVRTELRLLLADDNAAWATLEMASARRVRYRWDARFGQQSLSWDLLDAAEGGWPGASGTDVERRLDACWDMLVEAHEEPDFCPTYAGFAAHAAAKFAAFPVDPEVGASELELDVEEWDACFFASLAACGGAVWEDAAASDDSLRRAFWEWYLDEAARIGGAA